MATRLDRDEELVETRRQREPAAAEQLVITYGDRAYRLASRITGNEQDAAEIVQDAFWSVVQKIDSFRAESAFGSWLFRIVTNAAYQKLRCRKNRGRDISWDDVLPLFDEESRHIIPMAHWSSRVNDPAVQKELWLALTAGINDLPVDYRTVLVLRDVEGWSTLEIAERLGLHIPAVKTRAYRARLFLRKQLSDAVATPTHSQHWQEVSTNRSKKENDNGKTLRLPPRSGEHSEWTCTQRGSHHESRSTP